MLSNKDIRVLEFENSWWHYPEPKDRAIREYVGMSSTRYYQALRRLVEDETAADLYPLVVRRLCRMKRERQEALARRIDTTVG
ncbi:MAG: DUF3263 domain-containing protein [bacterium]|nr:DUF3263 domain-containing protein [bacterium]MCP4964382.1 DUF3263 domain-containing protein [bacterium]